MLLALLLQAVPAPGELRWHPPEAIAFVETPDMQRVLSAYERAPWVQMSRDEELRESFAGAFDKAGLDLDAALQAGLGELGWDAQVTWPASAVGLLSGVRRAALSVALHESEPGELARTTAQVLEASTEVHEIAAAVAQHALAHGAPPAALTELKLAPELLTDPWSKPYLFASGADAGPAHVMSLGSDGQPGGVGAASDVGEEFAFEVWSSEELKRRLALTATVTFVDSEHASTALGWLGGVTTELATSDELRESAKARRGEARSFHFNGDSSFTGWTFHAGDLVVLGLGSADLRASLERASRDGASIASHALLAALETHAPVKADAAPIVRGFTSGERLRELIDTTVDQRGGASAASVSAAKSLLQPGAFRMQLAGERFVTDVVLRGQGDDKGWLRAVGSTPVRAALTQWVPQDAIAVAVTTIDAPQLHQQLVELAGLSSNDAEARAQLAQLEERYGFSLERDLFGSLGHGVAAYVQPIVSLTGYPGAALVLELKDAAAFERGMNGIAKAMNEEPGSGAKVKSKPYKGAPMWTFSFDTGDEGGGMNPFAVSPTVCIVEGHALITLTSVRATKEIKRILGDEGAPHALAALERPADAGMLGYMDWPQLFNGLYTAGRGALSLLGSAGGLPFDVNAMASGLPDAAAITRFYKPTTLWSRPIEGGSHTHWEASFGPETWASLIVFGAQLGFGVQQSMQMDAGADAEVLDSTHAQAHEAEDATRATLDLLATRIAVFQLDQDRRPRSLDELAQPTTNYPSGFLDGATVPLDGWQRPFAYAPAADGASHRLWSLGADGVDGTSDDVVAP